VCVCRKTSVFCFLYWLPLHILRWLNVGSPNTVCKSPISQVRHGFSKLTVLKRFALMLPCKCWWYRGSPSSWNTFDPSFLKKYLNFFNSEIFIFLCLTRQNLLSIAFLDQCCSRKLTVFVERNVLGLCLTQPANMLKNPLSCGSHVVF